MCGLFFTLCYLFLLIIFEVVCLYQKFPKFMYLSFTHFRMYVALAHVFNVLSQHCPVKLNLSLHHFT